MTHSCSGETCVWKYYQDDFGDNAIDLRRFFNPVEDVVGYAYAEINVSQPIKMSLFLGSDDGVKVWLNGVLIHEAFTGRQLILDQDEMELKLNQGV